MRGRTTIGAALAATLALGAALTAETAAAGEKGKVQLVRPVSAPDSDAEGVVKIRVRRNKTKLKVTLRNLDPGHDYSVFDADTDELLGTGTANDKGRLRMKITRKDGQVSPAKVEERDVDLVVREDGTEAFLLVGGDIGDPMFADAFYGTLSGPNLNVSMFSDGDECDAMYVGLTARTEDGVAGYELYFDTVGDRELPLGVAGVSALAGRGFDVIDSEGTELLAGDLPQLRSLDDLLDGDFEISFPEAGDGDDTVFVAPFTLRIENDSEELTDVGEFRSWDLEFDDDFRFGYYGFGRYDEGISGSIGLYSDGTGECITADIFIPDGETTFGGDFYYWDASVSGKSGQLPLGVDSIDDLSGRLFELRDANGAVLVSDFLPDLEAAFFEPFGGNGLFDDGDREAIDAGTPPYSFFIADDANTLQKVGTLELVEIDDKPFPGPDPEPTDVRSGFLVLGDYLGDGASISLISDSLADYFDITLFKTSANDWNIWAYYASSDEDGLPLGVDSVEDLAGRAFEIRNRDGEAVIATELPELEDGFPYGDFGDGSSLDLGRAPYTLYIADDEGTLTKIAELTDLRDEVFGTAR